MRCKVCHVFLCFILLYSWGCVQKSAKLQKGLVPPDKTLFETGSEFLKGGRFIQARIAFTTLMSTYPDSDLASDASLAIGDSFYEEGGTENLLLAEDQYKNFIVFFPTNPNAAIAQLKIVSIHQKMMHSPDRDQKDTIKTEQEALKFLRDYPDSDYAPIVKEALLDAQENLAQADLGVAKFYYDKKNFAGSRGRLQEVMNKYPNVSIMDEVLYLYASGLEKTNNPEEAAIYYGKIARELPFSKHADEAKAHLNSLGKPIPSVDTLLAAANESRLKPSEGFSLLKPLIDFGKALGFAGPPDLYKEAKKAVEEEKIKNAEAAPKNPEGGPAGSDIQIQRTIKKNASGETTDTAIVGTSADPPKPNDQDKKKPANKLRKKNVKKSS